MTAKGSVSILVVDDDAEMREFLREILAERGYSVAAAAGAEEALEALGECEFHVVVSDIRMPGMDGVTLLEKVKAQAGFTPFVILITAFGDVEDTVKLIDQGAYDYLIKPFKMDQLLVAVKRAERELELRRRVEQLEGRPAARHSFHGVLGKSAAMLNIFALIEKVAAADGGVIVEGETGTGKEMVARALHEESPRREGPFVPINCAAIPDGLFESELFGHARGAFTGADRAKRGLLAEADGGTLFLDEIAEMPVPVQAKLLRCLQDRCVRPVGEAEAIPFDARIVAATNRDLEAEVAEGRFREDIFYRLDTFRVRVPPLRERREDIPLLVEAFASRHAAEGRSVTFTPEALRALMDYGWPGNVRELESAVERCAYVCEGKAVEIHDLPPAVREGVRPAERFAWPEGKTLAEVECAYIEHVLRRCDGNKVRAAEILGINRKTIQRRLGGNLPDAG